MSDSALALGQVHNLSIFQKASWSFFLPLPEIGFDSGHVVLVVNPLARDPFRFGQVSSVFRVNDAVIGYSRFLRNFHQATDSFKSHIVLLSYVDIRVINSQEFLRIAKKIWKTKKSPVFGQFPVRLLIQVSVYQTKIVPSSASPRSGVKRMPAEIEMMGIAGATPWNALGTPLTDKDLYDWQRANQENRRRNRSLRRI
jgi:hypothetical protein